MLFLQLHILLELACLLVNAVELILKVKWLTLQLYVRHYRTMTKVVNLLRCFRIIADLLSSSIPFQTVAVLAGWLTPINAS